MSENETLKALCSVEDPMALMVDIKAFGVESAIQIAKDVYSLVENYPQHSYHLCSFNEFCVRQLLEERELRSNDQHAVPHIIGVISSGVPIGMFDHLSGVDFISLDYNIVCEDIMEMFHNRKKKVYAWTVNAPDMQHYMIDICKVDGIIYDLFD